MIDIVIVNQPLSSTVRLENVVGNHLISSELRHQAEKVCNYLGNAYDGEPRRVILALLSALHSADTDRLTPNEKESPASPAAAPTVEAKP